MMFYFNVNNCFFFFFFISYFSISIFAQKKSDSEFHPSKPQGHHQHIESVVFKKRSLETIAADSSQTISHNVLKKAIYKRNFQRPPKKFSNVFSSKKAKNVFDRARKSLRSRKSRKKFRKGNKGRRKNNSEIVGMRKYKNQEVTVSSLCPDWPNNPSMLVICSNGRKFRSVCAISCRPGFRLRKGSPRKRRCRIHGKGRRKKTPKHSRLMWSGKDERFECVPVCDDLPMPKNGRFVCGNRRRNESINARTLRSCVVNCDPGFAPSSNLPRYCLDNGTWTGITSSCHEVPSKEKHPFFHLQQRFNCGNVRSLTTFAHHRENFLVAGDIATNQTRIYRWANDRFVEWQTLSIARPLVVETISGTRRHVWLLVGNEEQTAFYILNKQNRFEYTRLRRDYLITPPRVDKLEPVEGFNMVRTGSDVYRCRGQRSNTGRSVLIVQKLFRVKSKRPLYKRTMRKKFRKRWSMVQCLMFVADKKFFTAATLRKEDGKGQILVGVEERKRMRVIHSVVGENLRNISDLELVETANGKKYLVFAQSTPNGTCTVYGEKYGVRSRDAATST